MRRNKLYRMTTYTGAHLERLEVTDQKVRVRLMDRYYRLEVDANT